MNTNERIVIEAKKLLNIPFCFKGRTITQGVDCLGLVYVVLNRMGIDVPKFDDKPYTITWWKNEDYGERLLNAYLEHGFAFSGLPVIGGLACYRLHGSKVVNHAGIIINNNSFIHSHYSRNIRDRKVKVDNFVNEYKDPVCYLEYNRG